MPGKVSGGIGPLVSGPPCRHQGRPAAKWGGPLTKWMNACKSVLISRTRHRLNGTRKVLGGWSRTPRRAPETGHGTRTVDTVGTQGPSTTSCAATRRSSRIRIAHERSSKACRASAIIFDILSPLVGRKCRPPLATRLPSSPFKTSIFSRQKADFIRKKIILPPASSSPRPGGEAARWTSCAGRPISQTSWC